MKFTASISTKENIKQELAEEEIDTTKKLQPESIVQLSSKYLVKLLFNIQFLK